MLALLLLAFYAASTQAIYYIDDRNDSILYTGVPVSRWKPVFHVHSVNETM